MAHAIQAEYYTGFSCNMRVPEIAVGNRRGPLLYKDLVRRHTSRVRAVCEVRVRGSECGVRVGLKIKLEMENKIIFSGHSSDRWTTGAKRHHTG